MLFLKGLGLESLWSLPTLEFFDSVLTFREIMKLHFILEHNCLQQANITVVRSRGFYKQIQLLYETLNGTAVEGSDFGVTSGELIFKPTETIKTIYVEIYDDDLPEGPEDFSIVITKVELLGR